MRCENCGMPDDCVDGDGRTVKLSTITRGKYGTVKGRGRTVWCCSDECTWQAMAIARYGAATHRWPKQITMARFRAMNPLPDVSKSVSASGNPPSQVIDSTKSKKGSKSKVDLRGGQRSRAETSNTVEVTDSMERSHGVKLFSDPKGGRPRKWVSEAERHRAYRDRRKPGLVGGMR